MKRIFFLLGFAALMLFGWTLTGRAEAQAVTASETGTSVKVAVVPYLDSSEQDKDYVKGIIDEGYTNYFGKQSGVEVIPTEKVQAALKNAGYEPSDMVLPEKDTLAAVAKATGADFVVAMELSNLNAIRHVSFFQYKISVNVKLEYHFYQTKKDLMNAFKTTGSNDNATILGDVGFKAPITASLQQAMKKANDKITPVLQGKTL